MNREDKKLLADLVSYILDKKTSEREKLNIYGGLLRSRGQGCADHAMVLIRAHKSAKKRVAEVVKAECEGIFLNHPQLDTKPKWPVLLCIISFCSIAGVILLMMGLAMFGHKLPDDQRYLLSILMGLVGAAFVFGGASTATVSSSIPFGSKGKMAVKLGGAVGGLVGTYAMFQKIGY